MRYIFSVLFLSALVSFGNAQTLNELRESQKKARQNIDMTNKLLQETQRSSRTTITKLRVLNNQIKERQTLINSINKEVNLLGETIDVLTSEKTLLENRLQALKNEYANLVYHAYVRKSSYNELLFVFSAESFEQAYRRLRYLQEYSQYRKQQSIQIMAVTAELEQKKQQLEEQKTAKICAAKEKEKEAKKIQEAKKKEDKLLKDLKGKEQVLRTRLAQQQKQANDLNRKIQQLIAEEIRRAEEKAKAEAAKKAEAERARTTPSTTTPTAPKPSVTAGAITLTKEEALIAGNFENNKGRLPWPVERGVITGRFGIQAHPVLQHVTTDNKGIYIQTQANADARAVFEGVVTQVFSVPGSNNAVIIKHGNYRTVYANLTKIYVKVGDKVTTKQKVGRIFVDDENENKTELYFMVYKNTVLQNPESWIAR
jgi:septal ring factor EnvC (AmiA/AmiB activator)